MFRKFISIFRASVFVVVYLLDVCFVTFVWVCVAVFEKSLCARCLIFHLVIVYNCWHFMNCLIQFYMHYKPYRQLNIAHIIANLQITQSVGSVLSYNWKRLKHLNLYFKRPCVSRSTKLSSGCFSLTKMWLNHTSDSSAQEVMIFCSFMSLIARNLFAFII